MRAASESRRAGNRERRLLRAVDPELGDFLDERDLESARRQAKRLRRTYGLDKPPAKPKQKRRPMSNAEAVWWFLAWSAFVVVLVLLLTGHR
jgi:hypothetical protein